MKQLRTILPIIALGILISSCHPSQSTVETAVVQTMTALPTTTSFPTARPTRSPIPTKIPTARPTPVRKDLGVSLEQVQVMFEKYDFTFELFQVYLGETVMFGEYYGGPFVSLTARDSILTKVKYDIPIGVNLDEVSIPSLGDVVIVVLGEDFYQTKFIPWVGNGSRSFQDSLCYDGVLIKSYYFEWTNSINLTIMLEHEWSDGFGGCE